MRQNMYWNYKRGKREREDKGKEIIKGRKGGKRGKRENNETKQI